MKKKKKKVLWSVFVGLLLVLVFSAQAQHVQVEIAFLMDDSGSIIPKDFFLAMEGLARAISDPYVVPQDGTVSVAVILFSTSVRTVVPLTEVTPHTMRRIAWNIREAIQEAEGTNLALGIRKATRVLLSGRPYARKIICIVTDGRPTIGIDPIGEALIAADEARSMGIDEINAIAIGDFDLTFLRKLVYPPHGVHIAESFADFAEIISQKIRRMILPPPPPPPPPPRPDVEGLERLLYSQEKLIRSFEELLWEQWETLCPEEQERMLASFAELLEGQADRLRSFAKLIYPITIPQVELVISFERLLFSQAKLLQSFERLLATFFMPPMHLLDRFEMLLHQQADLIFQFEEILRCLESRIDPKVYLRLLISFEDLLRVQGELVQSFECLVRRVHC
jgi:uncharacterized protein YegL